MKKLPISLLCGIAAIIVTIVLYFVILGNAIIEAICLITLVGTVLAEVITTVFAYLSNGKPRRVAAAIISALLIPFSIVLSVIYIVSFPLGYATYVGLYFVGLVVIGLIAVILFFFDSKKQDEDSNFKNAKDNMLYLRKLAKCISNELTDTEYKQAFENIEEKLHFSNDSIIVAQDNSILDMLITAQQNVANPDFDMAGAIKELNKLIDTRKIMTSRTV